jgi:hypothetical protein
MIRQIYRHFLTIFSSLMFFIKLFSVRGSLSVSRNDKTKRPSYRRAFLLLIEAVVDQLAETCTVVAL